MYTKIKAYLLDIGQSIVNTKYDEFYGVEVEFLYLYYLHLCFYYYYIIIYLLFSFIFSIFSIFFVYILIS